MPTRLRKVRKMRGSRTHGWGQVSQHRASGQKGGVGNAGLHKHKWSWTIKYAPDHFGKDDMHPPKSSKPKRWINVGSLDKLYASIVSTSKVETVEGRPVLNLSSLGYEKLLGAGSVSGAYHIIIEKFTESAKEKILSAGGFIEGSK